MIEFFHNHASTYSQKVRICLEEKNLDYESRHINLGTFEYLTPEYLAINQNGVVPAMCGLRLQRLFARAQIFPTRFRNSRP